MAKASVSKCYCVKCGAEFPILRTNKRIREPGHLKKLFCLNCQEETNHVEVRGFGTYTYEDFIIEFNNGNFDENGKRRESNWRLFVAKHRGD